MPRRDRRTEIMRAVEKLADGRRFDEVVLDDIISQAGVGKGTIYRYFRDKDDLFFQTAMHGFEELCGVLSGVSTDGPFADRLVTACERISSFFRRRHAMFRMMHRPEWDRHAARPGLRSQWKARRRELVTALSAVIRQGIDEGAVRRDVPADTQAAFLLGMLRTRAREPDLTENAGGIELTVDLFLRGAGIRGHAGRSGRQRDSSPSRGRGR